jgi:ubiquinone biosynthesis protein
VTEYRDLSVRQFELGSLLGDGAELLRKNGIRLPSSLMRMVVVLMMIIDLGRTLDPGFRFTERIEPYLRDALRRELLSVEQAADAVRGLRDAAADTVALPGAIGAAARRFSQSPIEIDLVNDDFRRIETMLDQAGDKVLIGLVTAAIVVGSSLVLDNTAIPLPRWITIIAGIFYLGAVLIGFITIYHVLHNRP